MFLKSHYLSIHDHIFQNFDQRPILKSTGIIFLKPQPVITTRGLCYAINSKQMSDVFINNSKYLQDFREVFEKEDTGQMLKGHQNMDFDIDLQLSYLTDRTATSGSIW